MKRLRRNDPCHCGSGKKYKKCCWRDDQKQAAQRAAQERERIARLKSVGHPSDSDLRGLYEEVTGRNAPQGPIPPDARQMITELWQQRRLITQARLILEPREAEWAAYFADKEDEFTEIANKLSHHSFFDRYELIPANCTKVLEQLGELPSNPEALADYATQAIAITLDSDDRASFNEGILSLLPDLVHENRMKEAYVTLSCANRVLDPQAPISPFMRDMIKRSLSDKHL